MELVVVVAEEEEEDEDEDDDEKGIRKLRNAIMEAIRELMEAIREFMKGMVGFCFKITRGCEAWFLLWLEDM